MKEPVEKKQKQEPKPIDPQDFKRKINDIVDQLVIIESARDGIKEIQKYLKTEYGIASGDSRATATAVFKRNKEEIEEKSERVIALIEICE